MAANLARAGFGVRAWNRTRERAEPLAEQGVAIAGSPAEAAEGAVVVITMLSDAEAVEAVMADAIEHVGGIWAQMSTVGLEALERCAKLAGEARVPLVDAPVLGTKLPAQKGELIVLAAGPDDTRATLDPVFEAVGAKTVWLGGEPGAATRLKLVLNHWLLGLVENLGQTMALAEQLGVEPATFLETIDGAPMGSPYAQLKGKAMVDENFEPSFPLRLAAKDARLVQDASEGLPLIDLVARRLAEGVEAGHGDLDLAATYLTSTRHRS
jgi:3-hydroxyisobutyrate dehydrogenase